METAEALAPFLAGPASAVFVMLILLLGLWKMTTEKLIPMLGSALERHLNSLDSLIATNTADHKAMISCLERIEVKMDNNDRDDSLRAVQ
tara:strand:- start:339 stop:608 length:270 start_codon:yes stop_codon:yes gene_type:complete